VSINRRLKTSKNCMSKNCYWE